jgi:hypothetical protein
MAEQRIEEKEKTKKDNVDRELFSCLLQPVTADSDPQYIGIRRLLLFRKAESGALRRRVCSPFHCISHVINADTTKFEPFNLKVMVKI